ncbi:hypothetical protein ACJX0J_016129, partial [Zea mays]
MSLYVRISKLGLLLHVAPHILKMMAGNISWIQIIILDDKIIVVSTMLALGFAYVQIEILSIGDQDVKLHTLLYQHIFSSIYKLTARFLFLFLFDSFCTCTEAVEAKGLRDDTTCIVIDIISPYKPKRTIQSQRTPGKGLVLLKNFFLRKTTSDSLTLPDEDNYPEPDLEEVFEDGCPSLSR